MTLSDPPKLPDARRTVVCALAIIVITFLALGRVMHNDFVVWDDPQAISENPKLHPPTSESFAQIWSAPAVGLYVPLTYSAWACIAFATQNPFAFHLASLLTHCVSAIFVLLILRQLLRSDLAACIGAMVFAVHPLQVESVAWASGLKDVLAGMLALAALDLHLHRRSAGFIAGSSLCFALAMLAKPSAASAILIAVILDILVLRQSIRAVIVALLPWTLIALPLLVIARIVQETSLVLPIPIWQRPFVAGDALAFYLLKLIAPIPLAIEYGRNPTAVFASGSATWTWLIPVIVAVLIGWSRNRLLIAAGLIMLAGLIWNLGFAPFQFQIHSTVADHYMYLAMLGPALAAAWIVARAPRATLPIVGLVIAAMMVLTIRQSGYWRDSVTLFRHALDVNPQSIASHNNLGGYLGQHGDPAGAREQFRATLAIDPHDPEALNNLMIVDLDERIATLAATIEAAESRGQDVSAARREIVKLLASRGRWRDAADQLARAAAADPDNTDIANMLRFAREHATGTPTTAP